MARFFVDYENINEETGKAFIDGTDVNHVKNVLRKEIGEDLVLCNPSGAAFCCTIEGFAEGRVLCIIKHPISDTAEPRVPVTLYQGVPKSDKMELIVQKCVELGVTKIRPVITSRTIVKFGSEADKQKKTDRWQKIATEAAKQSGREIVPEIGKIIGFSEAVEEAFREGGTIIIPYENERDTTLKSVLREERFAGLTGPERISCFIGPEGGFSEEEIKLAGEKCAIPVTLGKRILRTETAGLAVMAAIRYELGD